MKAVQGILAWVFVSPLVCSVVAAQTIEDGDSSVNAPPMYVQMTDNVPRSGVTTTVYLGERMLLQRRGEWRDCLVTTFSDTDSHSLGMQTTTIRAGEPACKSDADARYYTPNYVNSSAGYVYDFRVDRDDGETVRICGRSGGVNAGCFDDVPVDQVHYGPWFIWTPNSVQQTIEYAGKSGDILNFIYAEFVDGMAREAFTREFQIDLSEGNVMAYRGAVIEIDEATNATITYRVVRNFPE